MRKLRASEQRIRRTLKNSARVSEARVRQRSQHGTIGSATSSSGTVPEAHAAVLRGSAITGTRYVDGAPFDADGPGTSDLDLTLVGGEVLRYYSAFWIPGIHSKPLSDTDPDIAPELTPLRRTVDGHGAAASEHPGHSRLAAALPRRHHESAIPHAVRHHPANREDAAASQLQHSQRRRGPRERAGSRHLLAAIRTS